MNSVVIFDHGAHETDCSSSSSGDDHQDCADDVCEDSDCDDSDCDFDNEG